MISQMDDRPNGHRNTQMEQNKSVVPCFVKKWGLRSDRFQRMRYLRVRGIQSADRVFNLCFFHDRRI